jgi:hypothetical protein
VTIYNINHDPFGLQSGFAAENKQLAPLVRDLQFGMPTQAATEMWNGASVAPQQQTYFN